MMRRPHAIRHSVIWIGVSVMLSLVFMGAIATPDEELDGSYNWLIGESDNASASGSWTICYGITEAWRQL